jgi:hypothetical protein
MPVVEAKHAVKTTAAKTISFQKVRIGREFSDAGCFRFLVLARRQIVLDAAY